MIPQGRVRNVCFNTLTMLSLRQLHHLLPVAVELQASSLCHMASYYFLLVSVSLVCNIHFSSRSLHFFPTSSTGTSTTAASSPAIAMIYMTTCDGHKQGSLTHSKIQFPHTHKFATQHKVFHVQYVILSSLSIVSLPTS